MCCLSGNMKTGRAGRLHLAQCILGRCKACETDTASSGLTLALTSGGDRGDQIPEKAHSCSPRWSLQLSLRTPVCALKVACHPKRAGLLLPVSSHAASECVSSSERACLSLLCMAVSSLDECKSGSSFLLPVLNLLLSGFSE